MKRPTVLPQTLLISVLAVILGLCILPMRLAPAAYICMNRVLDDPQYRVFVFLIQDILPHKAIELSMAEKAQLPVDQSSLLRPAAAMQRWSKFRSAYGDRPLYALLSGHLEVPYVDIPAVSKSSGPSKPPAVAASGELNAKQRDYIAFLKRGEQLDPDNALYNLRLANYYWSFSIINREHSLSKPEPSNDKYAHTDEDLGLPERPEVVNRKYVEEGLAEYDKALKKPLRLYQRELYEAAFRTLPKAVFVEQYMDRWITRYIVAPDGVDASSISTVSYWLAQQGDETKALHYLQSAPYLRMMTSDPGVTDDVVWYVIERIVNMTALRHDIMLKTGHKAEAKRLSEEHQRLEQLSMEYDQNYFDPLRVKYPDRPTSTLLAQTGWLIMCLILALLTAAALLRQAAWAGVLRAKHHQNRNGDESSLPQRLGAVTALVIIMLTIITIVAATRQWIPAMEAMIGISVLLVVCGGIIMRYQFKRRCQAAGIPVPGRWAELICNWLPVLLIAAYFWIEERMTSGSVYEFDAKTVRMLFALPMLAVLIAVMRIKLLTPDYYAQANLVWQRYLAALVVCISLVGMPLLIGCEVLVLQNDHSYLGAYKSAEDIANREQSRHGSYLGKTEKILRQFDR